MSPEIISVIGYGAAILTTTAFLPQAIKTWRTDSARDLSLPTFSMQTTGVFLWLVYGLLNWDVPLFLANGLTFLICLSVLVAIFRWRGKATP
ncbi:MAG: SemiSWEET transporter [Verrucomicrobiota bacterium]